ncbi:hypothetical protein [Bradyrhizobium genosp. P]|uniref:hypothetical protein n=1 Tax=Bradyrhizobium genosp. P TaxID=83641 RepID=UPI003CE71EAF
MIALVGTYIGICLGRYFRIFAIVPFWILAVCVLVLPTLSAQGLTHALFNALILLGCIQAGYIVGLVAGEFYLPRRRMSLRQTHRI